MRWGKVAAEAVVFSACTVLGLWVFLSPVPPRAEIEGILLLLAGLASGGWPRWGLTGCRPAAPGPGQRYR